MPIYEYKCNSCGKKFEKMEKFSDTPLEIHEECGGPVERLISAPALQFKGTGWYVTDYGRSNGRSIAAKNEGESKGESKKDSTERKSDGSSSSSSESKSTSTPASTSSSADKK
jgi:putative FmdB family regulatory protein